MKKKKKKETKTKEWKISSWMNKAIWFISLANMHRNDWVWFCFFYGQVLGGLLDKMKKKWGERKKMYARVIINRTETSIVFFRSFFRSFFYLALNIEQQTTTNQVTRTRTFGRGKFDVDGICESKEANLLFSFLNQLTNQLTNQPVLNVGRHGVIRGPRG